MSSDCFEDDSPILDVRVGATHTLAVNQRGKVYVWGWNDCGQCAKDMVDVSEVIAQSARSAHIFFQKEDLRIKQIVAAEDRNFVLLDDSKKAIVWGGNENGELGLGTYENEDKPKWLEFFSRQNLKVSMLAAGGDLTLCACENGESYAWPFAR